MKTMIAAIALLAVGATAMPNDAHAIGCLSGAAVGGVAGHYAGHHGVLGAAAGCAVGHHEKVVARRRAEQQEMNTPANGYAPR
jgi:hypothetical protein